MADSYTHEEMVKLCDESKRMMIAEFEEMVKELYKDVDNEAVWLFDSIIEGIKEIKSGNGLLEGEV